MYDFEGKLCMILVTLKQKGNKKNQCMLYVALVIPISKIMSWDK